MSKFLLWLLILMAPAGVAAQWLKAETPLFVAYSRGSEVDLRARVDELHRFDALLHLVTGLKPVAGNPPLTIYFIGDRDMAMFGVGSSVGGFYRASSDATYAVLAVDSARLGYDGGVRTVLFHEYVHHFLAQNSRVAYPAWYNEGFAEYLMTATFKGPTTEFGGIEKGRAAQLLRGEWLPASRLLTSRTGSLKGEETYAFYAQAWLAVHYLSRPDAPPGQLRAFLDGINRGVKGEEGFKAAFGMGYAAFDTQLKTYLRSRGMVRTRLTSREIAATPVAKISELPPSADDLLIPAAMLSGITFDRDESGDAAAKKSPARERRERAKADLLANIRRIAARTPTDPYALAVLAEAEVKLGDRARGNAMLDTALAASPQDAQFNYLRALSLISEAASPALPLAPSIVLRKRARKLLTTAATARPDDYRILAAHFVTYDSVDVPDTEFDVLMRAVELAPQVGEVAWRASRVLARRGDKETAAALLTPLANDPHGGKMADYYAGMLARLQRGEPLTDKETAAAIPAKP